MKILPAVFLTIAMLAPHPPVWAEPKFDVTRMEVGGYERWRVENGNTRVTYLGPDQGLYKFAFSRDRSKGQPAKGTVWTTRDGQTTRYESGSTWFTYEPHDCSLTVGTCNYRETRNDNKFRTMIRVTKLKGDVWNYWLYHTARKTENLDETGKFTVEPNGLIINADSINSEGYKAFGRRR